MTSTVQEQVNSGQIAKLLGISQPNVHKWLRHRDIEPVDEKPHPVGKLYDKAVVEAARVVWVADKEARAADKKRREAALEKAQGA